MSRLLCELSRSPGIGSLTILGTTTNVRLTLDQHVLAQLCLLATLDQTFSDIQVRPRGVDSAPHVSFMTLGVFFNVPAADGQVSAGTSSGLS